MVNGQLLVHHCKMTNPGLHLSPCQFGTKMVLRAGHIARRENTMFTVKKVLKRRYLNAQASELRFCNAQTDRFKDIFLSFLVL